MVTGVNAGSARRVGSCRCTVCSRATRRGPGEARGRPRRRLKSTSTECCAVAAVIDLSSLPSESSPQRARGHEGMGKGARKDGRERGRQAAAEEGLRERSSQPGCERTLHCRCTSRTRRRAPSTTGRPRWPSLRAPWRQRLRRSGSIAAGCARVCTESGASGRHAR